MGEDARFFAECDVNATIGVLLEYAHHSLPCYAFTYVQCHLRPAISITN